MSEVAFDTCVTANLAPSKVSHVSDVDLTPINQQNLSESSEEQNRHRQLIRSFLRGTYNFQLISPNPRKVVWFTRLVHYITNSTFAATLLCS